jgi:hypothetical protein
MASLAQQAGRTCADTGHDCAPEVMSAGGYIDEQKKTEIQCDPEVCIPGLGTLPSSVLNILNKPNDNKSLLRRLLDGSFIPSFGPAGQSADYNAPTPTTPQEKYIWAVWLNNDDTKSSIQEFLTTKGYTIDEKPRILLYIVPTGSHYVLINKDGKIDDPSRKEYKIEFASIPTIPYYYTLVLLKSDENVSNDGKMAFMNSSNPNLLELEKRMVELLVSQSQSQSHLKSESEKIKRLRELEEEDAAISRQLKELEERSYKRGKRGGKTNTKKKYRAKTTISTNKYAKRHRIRRSRRKSQGNRINNGKH